LDEVLLLMFVILECVLFCQMFSQVWYLSQSDERNR